MMIVRPRVYDRIPEFITRTYSPMRDFWSDRDEGSKIHAKAMKSVAAAASIPYKPPDSIVRDRAPFVWLAPVTDAAGAEDDELWLEALVPPVDAADAPADAEVGFELPELALGLVLAGSLLLSLKEPTRTPEAGATGPSKPSAF